MLAASRMSSRNDGSGTSITKTRPTAATGTAHSTMGVFANWTLTVSATVHPRPGLRPLLSSTDRRQNCGHRAIKFRGNVLPDLGRAVQGVSQRRIFNHRNAVPARHLLDLLRQQIAPFGDHH